MKNHFHEHFGYGSFISLLLFIIGNYIIYLMIYGNNSLAVFVMIFGLLIYVANNIIINIFDLESSFNNFLESLAVMLTFGVPTIVFGVLYYKQSPPLLAIILFYSICLALSLGRNNVLSLKNSIGWPIALNGLFFPLIYFFYLFYFNDTNNTIFIFYYITVGILSVSSYNFLGNADNIVQEQIEGNQRRLIREVVYEVEKEDEDVFRPQIQNNSISGNNNNNDNNNNNNNNNSMQDTKGKDDMQNQNVQSYQNIPVQNKVITSYQNSNPTEEYDLEDYIIDENDTTNNPNNNPIAKKEPKQTFIQGNTSNYNNKIESSEQSNSNSSIRQFFVKLFPKDTDSHHKTKHKSLSKSLFVKENVKANLGGGYKSRNSKAKIDLSNLKTKKIL